MNDFNDFGHQIVYHYNASGRLDSVVRLRPLQINWLEYSYSFTDLNRTFSDLFLLGENPAQRPRDDLPRVRILARPFLDY